MAEKHPQPDRANESSGAADGQPDRMDEEGGKGEKCEFFLSDALLDQVELYEPQARSRGIRIHPDVAPGIVYRGQEEEVRQLFGILFDNAMKYSTKDTEFVITHAPEKPPVSYDIHQ